ncbi:Crp/Fnr family transcriptional regulator [Devosia nitrariae]|uniref:Crp/Fnr family transcriptional regulator n=1 Tax=Devosia nitrariae TaxID=2071872 RepID=A0ABQ5W655_9HYPH|nr:Crp/Fnr family transcriptional regulator [Devosia nitrariae]GLQ55339.1 Crp/Fnr family transcriptional regulator [Devosia nitrariae]
MIDRNLVSIRPFLANLAGLVRMSEEELASLTHLIKALNHHQAHATILEEGAPADRIVVIMSGLAYRFTRLANGRRQITAFLVPGDICDYRFLSSGHVGQHVFALSQVAVARMQAESFVAASERFPVFMRAMLAANAVDEAIGREWMISLGQRNALQRMAHLLCEMELRLRRVGLVEKGTFHFPATQTDLGDALGLSSVHVNRTLQELRRMHLVAMSKGIVTLNDTAALRRLALFDVTSLGYERNGRAGAVTH